MDELIGTWRLVRTSAQSEQGETLAAPYGGSAAIGTITFSSHGRMAAVLYDGHNDSRVGSLREFVAYAGAFTYDGKELCTQVDASSRADWVGSQQKRKVSFEGDTLVLRPPLRPYAARQEQRMLYWQRIAAEP